LVCWPPAEQPLQQALFFLDAEVLGDDHKQLLKRGLVEETTRNGQKWWYVRFNQVDGPFGVPQGVPLRRRRASRHLANPTKPATATVIAAGSGTVVRAATVRISEIA
jgi:hypothetical protein